MSQIGMPCPDPDCDGTIGPDGFCDVCGLGAAPAVPVPAAPAVVAPAAPAVPGAVAAPAPAGASPRRRPPGRGPNGCVDPNCDGSVVDGFCDVCGLAGDSEFHGPGAGTGAPDAVSSEGSGSRSSRSRRTSRPTTRPDRLGAGMVDIPEIEVPRPDAMVLDNPAIEEHRRFCPNPTCRRPVGRSRDGKPGRATGFCGVCRTPFGFRPSLSPGDTVGPYKIIGALAHGGLGWVYLAGNEEVSRDFRVVLKGLINTADADVQNVAIKEKQFLASVKHTSIVQIHTVVQHAGTGYIVMEYVGGQSLRTVLRDRREANGGTPDPLPVDVGISYILAVLPAFAYLHRNGLVFCDFKPDNVMLSGDSLKLIDLGAVRRLDAALDDDASPVYGTKGYQAPEVPRVGPTIASDLYTVGRTLASLILNFRGNTSVYEYTMPPAHEHEVLTRHDSLYRFLRKATARRPDDRFVSADEMHDALLGVLREVVATDGRRPVHAPSRLFEGDRHVTGENPDGSRVTPPWSVLPMPRVDQTDPGASTLATLPDLEPSALVTLLSGVNPASVEIRLAIARAALEAGDADTAHATLDALAKDDEWEWRVDYYRGLLALTAGDAKAARAAFAKVYAEAPGELAPKLALALAAENAGDLGYAATMYDIVSRTDDTFTSAAFGLARVRAAAGDRAGAVDAYQRVPPTSAAYVDARMRLARLLGTTTAAGTPGREDLVEASRVLEALRLDAARHNRLARDLLRSALGLVVSGAVPGTGGVTVAGAALREHDLRRALESVYRELARQETGDTERYALVDEANRVRPRTLF